MKNVKFNVSFLLNALDELSYYVSSTEFMLIMDHFYTNNCKMVYLLQSTFGPFVSILELLNPIYSIKVHFVLYCSI